MTSQQFLELTTLLQQAITSSNVEMQTILRSILQSWSVFPNVVTASTANQEINLQNTPLVFLNLNTSTTLSFTGAQVGVYIFKITQAGTGSDAVTWPTNVKWAGGTPPTLTATLGAWDIITMLYDGTYFSGTSTLNFVV